MTDTNTDTNRMDTNAVLGDPHASARKVRQGLARRYNAERRFRYYGLAAILFGLGCVALLFADIVGKGHGAFRQTYLQLEVVYDKDVLGVSDVADSQQLAAADYSAVVKAALRERFGDVTERGARMALVQLVSNDATYRLQARLAADHQLLGGRETLWLLADDKVNNYFKTRDADDSAAASGISERQRQWIDQLDERGQIELHFNTRFFTNGDSREPEQAGIGGAIMGSLLTLVVTLALAFPVGVAAAVYLEEVAPKNAWTDLVEVNINNLAAVPSVIFGLLGLAVFINFFGVPRSAPITGGLVLAIMTLPTVVIVSRAAIKSVPPSIREAAIGIGASPMQVVLHHVLPLAMPGMLTGAIIGMARALGESAPLLMIGMVAFIVDVPGSFVEPSTVLPVQIYLWADSPERGFVEKTSAAIMVLLGFLMAMNAIAVILRKRLERRW